MPPVEQIMAQPYPTEKAVKDLVSVTSGQRLHKVVRKSSELSESKKSIGSLRFSPLTQSAKSSQEALDVAVSPRSTYSITKQPKRLISDDIAVVHSSKDVDLIAIENIWEDLNLDVLPLIQRHAVAAIATKWTSMKAKLVSFVGDVQTNAIKFSEAVMDKLHEEKEELKLQLIHKDEMLSALLKERSLLEHQLQQSTKSSRSVDRTIASQTHGQERKYSELLRDISSIREDYQLSQKGLHKMTADYKELMESKQQVLATLHSQRQQYDRISNLHKHLVARLEAYMLSNDMMTRQKEVPLSLTKEQHIKSVDSLKALCQSPEMSEELKKMIEMLTEKLGGVVDGKDRAESFVQQYLELPGSKTVDKLRDEKEFSDIDDKKTEKLISALSAFDKKLDKHVTFISSKLDTTSQDILRVQNTGSYSIAAPRSPEPGAPDGGERSRNKQYSLIRKELLSEAAKTLSTPTITPAVSQPSLCLHKTTAASSFPSKFTGTKYPPKKAEALWSREKSTVNEKNDIVTKQKEVSLSLTKEQHIRSVNNLKILCQSPEMSEELKEMTETLTKKIGGIIEGKDRADESIIQKYLEHPGLETIDKLREEMEFSDIDDKKAEKIISALSAFDKKLDKHVTFISSKLDAASQDILSVQNTGSYSVAGLRSPEPGAPDGGERSRSEQYSLIRKKLLSEAAKTLSAPTISPTVSQPSLHLYRTTAASSLPSTVTGTKYPPKKAEALWSREKSTVNEKNDMMTEQKEVPLSLSKEQRIKSVDSIKILRQSPETSEELKKMTEMLTEKIGGVIEGKDRAETFVQKYLKNPGLETIDKLRKEMEFSDIDNKKAEKVISALSAFDKKLDKHVTFISNKLDTASQDILRVQNTGVAALRSPEPGAPDGGERSCNKQYWLIRKELLSEAAKALSTPTINPTVSQPSLRLRRTIAASPFPSTVTGTKYPPKKPEALWSREKSTLNEKPILTESDELLLEQLRTKWITMDYRTGTKLCNLKGPKHQARLNAVRGYFVDEKIAPLPITPQHHRRQKVDPFEPDCYQIPQCIDAKYSKPTNTRRENTIVYKSLNFID